MLEDSKNCGTNVDDVVDRDRKRTFYQVGYSIGEHFKSRIHEYLHRSDLPFQSTFLPFIKENSNCLEPWIQTTSELFPNYMDEIRGLADGSQTSFEWIFALNMLNELRSKIQKHHQDLEEKSKSAIQVPKVGGCSEVFVLSDSLFKGEKAIVAHNEDADKSMGEYAYIVKARYLKSNNETNKTIVAYHYPGTLAGNTFGWNAHLIFGTNGKSPLNVLTEKGIPRCFINRSVYESESIEEAFETLKKYAMQGASGFSTNISTRYKVDIHEDSVKPKHKRNQEQPYRFYRMCNIELAPPLESNICISMYNVPIGDEDDDHNHSPIHYAHFNHYTHLKGVMEGNVPSSRRRYERSLSFKNICDEDGVRQFLGDTHDTEFPIFRCQRFPDKGKTLATMIANVVEKKIRIYVGNPKFEPPIYEIDL